MDQKSLLQTIKKILYFPIAHYFRFFAEIKLRRWNPKVVVITGSSGKTSLLSLVESQVGNRAEYSHHANSAYGIPFNILGLERKSFSIIEWPVFFLLAPFKSLSQVSTKKIYVVEADCDRPKEGHFLATLLKPSVTLWTNSARTHSMNFDDLVEKRRFKTVEEAIGFEYAHFLEKTKNLAIVNGDSAIVKQQLLRTKAKVISVSMKNLTSFKISTQGTEFEINGEILKFKALLPKETYYSLMMCLNLLSYLEILPDKSFEKFKLPPGRSSLFNGIKEINIVDSSYNANLDSMSAILAMFEDIKCERKWAVIGDMLEQGQEEGEEHEKLAKILSKIKLEKVILMGPRVSEYTYPKLKGLVDNKVEIERFMNPKDVLEYLKLNLKGKELVLFKGARFLEGVIENLLEDKTDASNLSRREKIWEVRRKKWGL